MRYFGNKSLDAEIDIDIENGQILMDYSLNKNGSPYDSNSSVILKNDLQQLRGKQKIIERCKISLWLIASLVYGITTTPILTFLTEHKYLKSKNWQLEHQRILKILYANTTGINIIRYETSDTKEIRHLMSKNIWCSWKLEGSFQTEIKSIALKRHFIKKTVLGKFEKVRQDGWDLIFKFNNPPKDGYLVIEYV